MPVADGAAWRTLIACRDEDQAACEDSAARARQRLCHLLTQTKQAAQAAQQQDRATVRGAIEQAELASLTYVAAAVEQLQLYAKDMHEAQRVREGRLTVQADLAQLEHKMRILGEQLREETNGRVRFEAQASDSGLSQRVLRAVVQNQDPATHRVRVTPTRVFHISHSDARQAWMQTAQRHVAGQMRSLFTTVPLAAVPRIIAFGLHTDLPDSQQQQQQQQHVFRRFWDLPGAADRQHACDAQLAYTAYHECREQAPLRMRDVRFSRLALMPGEREDASRSLLPSTALLLCRVILGSVHEAPDAAAAAAYTGDADSVYDCASGQYTLRDAGRVLPEFLVLRMYEDETERSGKASMMRSGVSSLVSATSKQIDATACAVLDTVAVQQRVQRERVSATLHACEAVQQGRMQQLRARADAAAGVTRMLRDLAGPILATAVNGSGEPYAAASSAAAMTCIAAEAAVPSVRPSSSPMGRVLHRQHSVPGRMFGFQAPTYSSARKLDV